MGRKSKGLYLALQHIYEGNWIKPTLELCQQLFRSAVLPVFLTMTTLAFVLQFYLWLRLRWFSTAQELHHEALCVYQQQQTKKSIRKVHNLLQRAIQRDPTYQPAYLSLAASYLYPPDYSSKQRDPERALQVLSQCRRNTEGGEEIIRALILDCQAIQSGQEQMVLDTLRQDEYLNRAFAKKRCSKSSAQKCSTSFKKQEPDESKKDK